MFDDIKINAKTQKNMKITSSLTKDSPKCNLLAFTSKVQ